ncbi:MAG TPA: hypothetical protein VLM05_16875 [Mycobacteriales bacterium]|nr:hypothetical protein [Mycobacteriales bacterium]
MDTAVDVGTEFLALVCADEELLRAEFEQIVAAGWGPPPLPARGPRGRRGPVPSGRHRASDAGPTRRTSAEPDCDEWARQRSPPRGAASRTR